MTAIPLRIVAATALLLAAGCASYDGSTLVPGRSSATEVEALMGRPAQTLQQSGEAVWYYPRGPAGWHTYAVRIGPDGVVRAVEQRLTVENIARLQAGSTTRQEVRELFGPPFETGYLPRQMREVWGYQLLEVDFKWQLWVQFSDDGVVREVLKMRHREMDPDDMFPGPRLWRR